MRHDKVCVHLHYSKCKALGLDTTENWYINTHTNWYVNINMIQCYKLKGYRQTDKDREVIQIGQM